MGVSVLLVERCVADVRVRDGDVVTGEQDIATSFRELVRADRVSLHIVSLPDEATSRDTGFPGKFVTGIFFLDRGIYAFRRVPVATGDLLVTGAGITMSGSSFHEAVTQRAGTESVLSRDRWSVTGISRGDGIYLHR